MGKGLPDPAHDLQHGFLVVRMERLPPQQGQPPDMLRSQGGQQRVHGLLGKRLSELEVPGLRIETAGTAVGTAGHEQRNPHAGTVGNIRFFQICVVHNALLTGQKVR